MLKQNLKATAMPWEKHTLRVVDRHKEEKTPSVGDKLMVANKSLVVEKSLLVDHNKWQNQAELAESLRQLREANTNKEDH